MLSKSLTANTYRGSLITVSPSPVIYQSINFNRATRHSSVNLVKALFKMAGLLKLEHPVSFRLGQGVNNFVNCINARQWGV